MEEPKPKFEMEKFAGDILSWKNEKTSAIVLCAMIAIWFLFRVMKLHLVTLVCHSLILSLSVLFLWSDAEFSISKELVVQTAFALRDKINSGYTVFRNIALGRNLGMLIQVIVDLRFLAFLAKNDYLFNCIMFCSVFSLAIGGWEKIEKEFYAVFWRAWGKISLKEKEEVES